MKRHIILLLLLIQTVLIFSGTTDYLHTSGNRILDAQSREVWITGVNWFGYETSQMVFHGLWNRDLRSLLDQVVDFGFNALRVPLHPAGILALITK